MSSRRVGDKVTVIFGAFPAQGIITGHRGDTWKVFIPGTGLTRFCSDSELESEAPIQGETFTQFQPSDEGNL